MDSSLALSGAYLSKKLYFWRPEELREKKDQFFKVRKDEITYFKVIDEKNEAKL